jgi:sarcosine oxidase subunit beta
LQAYVTNGYAQSLGPIVSSTEFLAYVSQTARGQMLIGHEYEREQSFSLQSSFQFLQNCSAKMSYMLPFLRDLKILRQWTGRCDISADFSPIMGFTGIDGLVLTTGWGTWGFKAIPAGGEQMAELIASGQTPEMIAPFALSRFAADHAMADQGSTGTR